MRDDANLNAEALRLTRSALTALDAAGLDNAALHVQAALDILLGSPIPRTDADVEVFLQSDENQALLARLLPTEKVRN